MSDAWKSVWLAIYLPRLNTDRLIRSGQAPEGCALAVYAKKAGAFLLTGVDARASALGLRLAMSLADARAIHPKLAAVEADPDEDARTLDNIAAWCERFTPIVILDPPDGLFLDVTGCAHLFGGERALCDHIVTRLHAQGFASRAAIAPTPGAAWALARYTAKATLSLAERVACESTPSEGRSNAQAPDHLHAHHPLTPSPQGRGGIAQALAPLPIEALRLEEEAASLLKRVGLKTIGQIIDKPRAPLVARAGEHAMLRLDQALGLASEALTPRRPPPPVFALRRFLEPLFSVDTILIAAERLCEDAVRELDVRSAGVRRAALHLFGVDGRNRVIEIGVSRPERSVRSLLRLFREKLNLAAEDLNAEFGIEAARLDVVQLENVREDSCFLVDVGQAAASAEQINAIVDVLSARLGPERVLRPKLVETHNPERAAGWRPALRDKKIETKHRPPRDGVMRRPLMLFARPQAIEALAAVPDGPPIRFRWRRLLREVARAEGPERISGDWMGDELTRDYYRVEDKSGRRYWLYREGLYGEGDAPPRWFIHGLFA
jgi:protein ImuB